MLKWRPGRPYFMQKLWYARTEGFGLVEWYDDVGSLACHPRILCLQLHGQIHCNCSINNNPFTNSLKYKLLKILVFNFRLIDYIYLVSKITLSTSE